MKKLRIVLVLTAFCAAAAGLSAKGGIEAGYMNLGYTVSGGGISDSQPSLNGFYVGVSEDMNLLAGLGIRIGLNYSYAVDRSAESLIQGVGMKGASEKDHYINVPLRLRYNFNLIPKVLKIQAFAGPVFSVGLSHTHKFDFSMEIGGNTVGGSVNYNYYTGKFKGDVDTDAIETSSLPSYKRFDVALGGGVGVELFNFLEIKAGYDWGLMNRMKEDLADVMSCKRNMFYLAVGFRF